MLRCYQFHQTKMTIDSPRFFRWHGLGVVEILHEQDLILRFVIQKFVGAGLCHQDSKSTWANSLFFANGHMGYRLRFRLADRCMSESLE